MKNLAKRSDSPKSFTGSISSISEVLKLVNEETDTIKCGRTLAYNFLLCVNFRTVKSSFLPGGNFFSA